MKKKVIAVILVTGLTLATVASANCGKYGNSGNEYGKCGKRQVMMDPQMDQEIKTKMRQFFKDNQALHKELAMKKAEKRALMRHDQPDPAAAAKVTGELFDLHNALREKAELAGVDEYIGPPMMGGQGRAYCSGKGHRAGKGKMQKQ